MNYQIFVEPKNVKLAGNPYQVEEDKNNVHTWMELLTPTTAETLANYDHPAWGEYAAITGNEYGKGYATYIGCIVTSEIMSGILKQAVKRAGLWGPEQEVNFPLIIKSSVNEEGKTIKFVFNYSFDEQVLESPFGESIDLLSDTSYQSGEALTVKPWDFKILEVK